MPVNLEELGSLAGAYTQDLTSIRGRRVQRLIKREFVGADAVCIVRNRWGRPAMLGVSSTGAALCDTDGTGKFAAVLLWMHGSGQAIEKRFDLLKDSLPVLTTAVIPISELRGRVLARTAIRVNAPGTKSMVARALEAVV